jgi:outer membrane receptor for ferrienterochelin and colicin
MFSGTHAGAPRETEIGSVRECMRSLIALAVVIVAGCVPCAFAAEATGNAEGDAAGAGVPAALSPLEDAGLDLYDDELLLFEDMPVVISASRQAQPLDLLSAPISIITSEDIHHSGLTSIPDVLQFTPGVDVFRLDRNRHAVGVHGMHDVYSDRTLVLIDGRSAYSNVFGGCEWWRLPVFLEDIDRIEVVRGPGGAAWGANAFNGVVNILTKDPEKTQGWLASSTVSHFGDTYNHVRWGSSMGNLSWRTSWGYLDSKSSDSAGAGRYGATSANMAALMNLPQFKSRDYVRNWVIDHQFVYRASDHAKVSFGGAHSNLTSGNYELLGYFPPDNQRYRTTRLFARLDRKDPTGDASGYLQWFGNFNSTDLGGHSRYRDRVNDVEGQYDVAVGEDHKLSVGGNLRLIHINPQKPNDQSFVFPREPFDEQVFGVFGIDRWQVSDPLVIESQIRADWYSETKMDWSGRLSALYAMDADKRHILRLSGAKAFRTPMVTLRGAQTSRLPVPSPPAPPGLYSANLVTPSRDLQNEEIYSLELGYSGRLAKGLTLRVNAYAQRYEDLIAAIHATEPAPQIGRVFYAYTNRGGATAWGAETEVAYENKTGKLGLWYAHNDLQPDKTRESYRAYRPSPHKAGLTGRLFLSRDWALNANFAYRGEGVYEDVDASHFEVDSEYRLDLTVSKKLFNDHAELMVGVSDVLAKDTNREWPQGSSAALTTPGRTFFVRMQLSF